MAPDGQKHSSSKPKYARKRKARQVDRKKKAGRKQQRQHQKTRIEKLASRLDFAASCVSDDNDAFFDFESSPQTAALLYHVNSGHERFRRVRDHMAEAARTGESLNQEALREVEEDLFNEMLTGEELDALVEMHLRNQGRAQKGRSCKVEGLPDSIEPHMLVCGMCGRTAVQGRYEQECQLTKLSDLPSCVSYTDEDHKVLKTLKDLGGVRLPIDEEGHSQEFELWRAISHYESSKLGQTFHLHQEYVQVGQDGAEAVMLCSACHGWHAGVKRAHEKAAREGKPFEPPSPPPMSIANGVDFGSVQRLGLPEPSVPERILIAKARHFHNVIKIQSNHGSNKRSDFGKSALRASSIAFRHDAAMVTAMALAYENVMNVLKANITVELLGPEREFEKLARKAKMQTLLQARAHVVFTWLAVLQHLHIAYKDDPKLQPADFHELKVALGRCTSDLIDGAVHVSDKKSLLAEQIIGDDVAQASNVAESLS